jgi:high-affinity K+ transport system ATPase subunit B
MISLLFTPLGRYAIIGIVVVMALFGVYLKIRSDAVAEIEAKATSDVLRRTQDAIRAGDAVDTSPDRLLQSDGHRRD